MAKSIVEKITSAAFNKVMHRSLNTGLNAVMSAIGVDKKPKKLMPHELQSLLDKHAEDYSLDLLNGKQFWRSEPIVDLTLTEIRNELSAEHNVKISEGEIKRAVRVACARNAFNPVQQHLEGLPRWDRTNRIPELFDLMHIKAEDAEHRALLERALLAFLVACVARASKPGCQCDSMLIIKGATGLRKSTFLKLLACNDEWFSSAMLDLNQKDSLQIINQFWLFEIAEMASFLRRPANTVKAFVSRTRDDYRAAYGRSVETHERHIVFVGSTNQEKFLTDPLSTRRFWVVEVGDTIDTEGFLLIRDALWAQALAEYKLGTPWHLDPADETAMAERMKQYQV